jgi:hypothetical protein
MDIGFLHFFVSLLIITPTMYIYVKITKRANKQRTSLQLQAGK